METHKIDPVVFQPLSSEALCALQNHIKEVRRCFDWPGIPYHDANEPEANRFNRWYWHNLPLLRSIHNSAEFIATATKIFGRAVKPSYVFLSMYGLEGVCPLHQDRQQCQFTIDLCVNSDGEWPIFVDEKPYVSKPGDALAYSGTGQPHYRKSMKESGTCTYMDLAFFHFVPTEWQGALG
jgi:hypothetical protein